jgi:hypothetical protein
VCIALFLAGHKPIPCRWTLSAEEQMDFIHIRRACLDPKIQVIRAYYVGIRSPWLMGTAEDNGDRDPPRTYSGSLIYVEGSLS